MADTLTALAREQAEKEIREWASEAIAVGITRDQIMEWVDEVIEKDDEYPSCETCGEPIDYCQGHGPIARKVMADG